MLVDSIYINFVSIVREQMAKWVQEIVNCYWHRFWARRD